MSDSEAPKRKVGRPKNPERFEQRAKRRFIPLEKTPATIELMRLAHLQYQERFGKTGTDAAVIRAALNWFIE